MRRTLRSQIASNHRLSLFYCALVVVVLGGLGAAIFGVYEPNFWWLGGVAAALVGLVVALTGWYGGSKIVLSLSKAHEATPLEMQRLQNVVEEMAIAAGIPAPQVFVIDDSSPNAFATGRDPEHGVVVVTQGLLDKLDREQLQAVVAHEIGHIRNMDIRLMTTLALVAGLIPLLADVFGRMMWHGGRGSKKDGAAVFLVVALVLMIVAPISAKLLEMAVSRRREYLADATSAELTRNPEALVSALEAISSDRDKLEVAGRATAHMYIVNPLKKLTRGDSWLSTHPSLESRVRALRQLAGGYRATPPE